MFKFWIALNPKGTFQSRVISYERRANKIGTKFGGGGKIGIGKRGRAKIPPQPPSFLPARPVRRSFNAGGAIGFQNSQSGFSFKKSSDFNQKAPPIFRIRILGDFCLAPPEAGLGFGVTAVRQDERKRASS